MSINFVAIDFETANCKRSSACSIGYTVVENGEIVTTGEHLIKPVPFEFDPMNTMIHGIKKEDVINSKNIIEVWNEISHLFNDKVLVAHNASFDMSVLRHSFEYFDSPYPECKYICTYRLAEIIWPDNGSYRLDSLANRLGLSFHHHQAYDDSLVCAKLLLEFLKEYEVNSIDNLLNKMNLSYGYIHPYDYTPFSVCKKTAYSKSYIPSFLSIPYTELEDEDENNISPEDNIFSNKKVVVTGTFEVCERKQVESNIKLLGGILSGTVSKNTDFLVIGGRGFTHNSTGTPGSKYNKAIDLKSKGIPIKILSESDFLSIWNNSTNGANFKESNNLSKNKKINLPVSFDYDFETNAAAYDYNWALRYREEHGSQENVVLYLSQTSYDWTTHDNVVEINGENYSIKITFFDLRNNCIEIHNNITGKDLKPKKISMIQTLIKEFNSKLK